MFKNLVEEVAKNPKDTNWKNLNSQKTVRVLKKYPNLVSYANTACISISDWADLALVQPNLIPENIFRKFSKEDLFKTLRKHPSMKVKANAETLRDLPEKKQEILKQKNAWI